MAMGGGSASGGSRGRRGRRSRRAAMSEINVTPMVDVMLVLLIIFMVTAPLLKAGIPVELPESRANPLSENNKQINLTLTRDGTIELDGDRVLPDSLPGKLAAVPPGPDGKPPLVTLRADKALDYGRVIAVMGELNRAGFRSISLVTSAGGKGPAGR